MKAAIKTKLLDACVALAAVLAGAVIVYLGDRLVATRMEFFFGVETFSLWWVLDLFGVPFIAGIAVSFIYGLGGKILAHLSPVIVRCISYYEVTHGLVPIPHGITVVPMPYWLLMVVISAEFAAFGGVVGEIITKKTYGRTANKALLHKKYQRLGPVRGKLEDTLRPKRPAEGVDQ